MAVALSLSLGLAGCAPAPVAGPAPGRAAVAQPLRVTNGDRPFAYHEGAAARRMAEAACAGQGKRLRPSMYDRFEAGAWIYVEGCA